MTEDHDWLALCWLRLDKHTGMFGAIIFNLLTSFYVITKMAIFSLTN